MAKLGETAARLAKLRRQMQAPAGGSAGDGRMTETPAFGANPGALRMLTYAPSNLPKKAPLVVVLHGCTQRAGAYADQAGWITLADREGFCVLAPEQTSGNNPNRCFNWFQPGDIARGQGEAASIHAMVLQAVKAHDLDPRRVFVTGLSAGGAMTAVMLAAYPETFAAGAVVAGLPYGVAGNVQEALRAMHGGLSQDSADLAALARRAAPAGGRVPRLSVWHGEADGTVSVGNGRAVARQWAALHRLADDPDDLETLTGRTRSSWRNADGETLVQLNLIAGLGHGTPLAAGGADPLGAVAPYMLEAGVSSSLEIARFWGLAPAGAASLAAPQVTKVTKVVETVEPPATASNDLGAQVMATLAGRVAPDIQGVISKALRTAGLMK
jgi:poly(hydroxyalkanoate) depolymerase family esterase